eukprot:CAMPEP_0202811236 /NCGR_PEP_ID=MMETSP1389-20130828/3149_1 /ASSEMBLY_ACC=CAM_ASM_000865 /TAXON_ID=302021 /ORGANISM="Rhodomonas sp., Strain CCMP768" /LENGTH=56 /DNA_ID=CAMNT_0049482319 /DNA_START=71 /DNA_END=237 /DNA_ORIENTATION=+
MNAQWTGERPPCPMRAARGRTLCRAGLDETPATWSLRPFSFAARRDVVQLPLAAPL